MSESVEEETFTPRDRLVKWLHIIMISLCVLATLVLFNSPSTGVKLIISFFLIAYTLTIVINAKTIKLIFKLGQTQAEQSYRSVHQWKIETDNTSKESKVHQENPVYNNTNFLWRKNDTEPAGNGSLDKSVERSQEMKNMSMSIYRSLSASGINDSRLSRMKSSLKKQDLKGHDLSEAFAFRNVQDPQSSTLRSQGSGIVLVDNQTYLSSKTEKFLEQAETRYEEILKKRLKKDRRFVTSKYESILNYLKNVLKSYMNEHRFAADKIKELSKEYFDLILTDIDKDTDFEVNLKKTTFHQKIPFNALIYRLMLLKEDKIRVTETGLSLKMDKRWSSVQPRMEESLRAMIRLGEVLGLDSGLLSSRFKQNTRTFVTEYFATIQMVESYLNTEAKKDRGEQTSSSALCYASKCRTFVLYLLVKQFNNSLKYAGKIKLNDNLNLRYPHPDKVEFQITKRPGSEDPLLHFDIELKADGHRQDTIYCEPGQRNYLSVIFCLLQELSKKADLLTWNMDIKQLVNEMA